MRNSRSFWVRSAVLVVLALFLGSLPGQSSHAQSGNTASSRPVNGQAAIDMLGGRLAQVAAGYGMEAGLLKGLFLSDYTLYVDVSDELLYIDDPFTADALVSQAGESLEAVPPFPTSQTFLLHSLPGADHTIYLDFDGHVTQNTTWNSSYGITTINSPPYDIDGNPAVFGTTEHERIQKTWQIVSEDFRPFNVNVTTEDPGAAALSKSGSGDTAWGTRVVITDDTFAGCGCGGHAYIGSFDDPQDEPVFVYNSSLTGVAEASSHEVGHAMLLSHDGTSSVTYYSGHGSGATSWGPIMGASYNRSLTHWSRGEYYDSNNAGAGANYGNGPDDFAIIASLTNGNGFGYRPDDHGDTNATATVLDAVQGAVSDSGIIENAADVDVFSLETAGGPLSLSFTPFQTNVNLDIRASLYDSSGSHVLTYNSSSTTSASLSYTLLPGTYYVHVDGAGWGNPLNSSPSGYTDYGSTGEYAITGSFVQDTITFAAVGDYGEDSTAEGDVAAMIAGWNVDFVVTQGDNRYGALSFDQAVGKYYCAFLKDVTSGTNCAGGAASTNAFFPATGNHDYSDGLGGGIGEYTGYFALPGTGVSSTGTSGSELYYDFIQGPVHFFVIDSQGGLNSGSNLAAQQTWLQAQISASAAPWQMVVLHHAPYSSANHGSNAAMQWDYAAWGADAVLAGHDHTYERIHQDGILYFINGLGGRSLYSCGTPIPGSQICYDSDYGAMLIEAANTYMLFKFLNRSGAEQDSYLLSAGPPPPPPPPPPAGTLDVQISGSNDDVEELANTVPAGNAGDVDTNSSDIEIGDDPGFNEDQTVGLLFRNLTVPQGATITSAYLEFTVDEVDSGATSVSIWAEDADNPADFAALSYNVTSRSKTSASVAWNSIPAWNSVGADQQSPDLSSIVQEVVDRAGWASGNKMVFIIQGTGSRTAESFDGSTPQEAARLHIEYDTTIPNAAPKAGFTWVTTGLITVFTDTSTDTDGAVASWSWDFGDGSTSTAQHPGHTYALTGTKTVVLTATDNDGTGSLDTASVGPQIDFARAFSNPTTVAISASGINTATSDIVVSGMTGMLADVNVRLDVSHTRDRDLDVSLVAPDGTRIDLFTDVGGNGDDFTGTVLDDEAATAIQNGSAPFTGSFRPENDALSILDGKDPNGTWTLAVHDDANTNGGSLNEWSLVFSFVDGKTQEHGSTNDVSISPSGTVTVTSDIVVGGMSGAIADVDVRLDITHSWDADLDVTLIAPDGTPISLFSDVGGDGDNFTGTVLDDEAATAIQAASPPFTGRYRPENDPLSLLDGKDPNGTWTLVVHDDADNDGGTLNEWSLRIFVQDAPPAPVLDLGIGLSGIDVMLSWTVIGLNINGQTATVDHYNIYRSTSPHFTPGPGTLLGTSVTGGFTDAGAGDDGVAYYYFITAVSDLGLESVVSNPVGFFPILIYL